MCAFTTWSTFSQWIPRSSPVGREMGSLVSVQWRHNELDSLSNGRRLLCLLNCWFRRRSKKTLKLCVTGLCEGNSPVTGEFPAQKASNVENVSIWWRHLFKLWLTFFLSHSNTACKTVQFERVLTTASSIQMYIDGLMQDCSNSSALAMELLQSCTTPSLCGKWVRMMAICSAVRSRQLLMMYDVWSTKVYSNNSPCYEDMVTKSFYYMYSSVCLLMGQHHMLPGYLRTQLWPWLGPINLRSRPENHIIGD